MACHKPQGLINAAAILGPLVIVFVVLGFATDHWVDTDVDRTKLNDIEYALSNSNQEISRIFHSRHKGILRECYPEDSALFLDQAQNVVSDDCFYIDFDDPEGVDMSSEYMMRMNLLRSVLATYVLGVVAIILTFVMGMVLCFSKNCHVAHAASVCSFFGALFVLAAIVLFHAVEYVEANKDGEPGEVIFHNTWSSRLLQATDSELGYSYALAWVGFILALLDACLYVLAARALRLNQLAYDSSSSDTSSTSGRKHVIKESPYESSMAYDNYGMKYAAYPTAYPAAAALPGPAMQALPAPMFMEGYPPTLMQTMPAYPSLSYGNSVYKMGSDRSREG